MNPLEDLKSLASASRIVASDFRETKSRLEAEAASQYFRRQLLRIFISYIEVTTYTQKSVVLNVRRNIYTVWKSDHPIKKRLGEYFDLDIEHYETAVLNEESIELDDSGEIRVSPKYLSFMRNLKFANKCFIKTIKLDYSIEYTHHGWASLRRVLERRNRLTHPRSESDLIVSDSDIEDLNTASEWYMETTAKLIVAGTKKVEAFSRLLDEYSKT